MRKIRQARGNHRAQHQRRRKHAYALRERAHDEKQRGRDVLGRRAEAPIEQLVGRQHVPGEVRRDEQHRDQHARHHVAHHDLQVGEVAAELGPGKRRERDRRHADERQRARLGRDDREADHPPADVARADEVVGDRVLRAAEARAERRDAGEVEKEHAVVEERKSHGVESDAPRVPGDCVKKSVDNARRNGFTICRGSLGRLPGSCQLLTAARHVL